MHDTRNPIWQNGWIGTNRIISFGDEECYAFALNQTMRQPTLARAHYDNIPKLYVRWGNARQYNSISRKERRSHALRANGHGERLARHQVFAHQPLHMLLEVE